MISKKNLSILQEHCIVIDSLYLYSAVKNIVLYRKKKRRQVPAPMSSQSKTDSDGMKQKEQREKQKREERIPKRTGEATRENEVKRRMNAE